MTVEVRFTVNGDVVSWRGEPLARLLDVLRRDLALTGAKEGCGEGECGSCTVRLDGAVVCSCLVPMLQVDGRDVRTVEGLARNGLTAVQRAFIDEGAVQCGACTPGMVMTAEALLDFDPRPTPHEIRERLAGNLCRCTGYEAVVRAVTRAGRERRERR